MILRIQALIGFLCLALAVYFLLLTRTNSLPAAMPMPAMMTQARSAA